LHIDALKYTESSLAVPVDVQLIPCGHLVCGEVRA
jgi:hypothetical protein